MNKQEFEDGFKKEAGDLWTNHRSWVLAAAIFVIAFILGAVSCHK